MALLLREMVGDANELMESCCEILHSHKTLAEAGYLQQSSLSDKISITLA